MATRTAVKKEDEATPRLIWQEVDDEMNILKTCQSAVESLEIGHDITGDAPISSTFFNSFHRLKDLLTEIMENYEEVKGVEENHAEVKKIKVNVLETLRV